MEKQVLENHVIKPAVSIFESDTEYRLMPFMTELSLDSKITEIENFMTNNNGFGKSEFEKDELYEKAKGLWHTFTKEFKEVAYTFYLNRKQYQYLLDLLKDKLEYDVNTVFFAIELVKLLGEWEESGAADNDKSLKGYLADATETTYIYHLLAKHKIKGLSNATYRFSEILLKIGEISKIVSYYDTHAKALSKGIQDWVSSFDESTPTNQEPVDVNSVTV